MPETSVLGHLPASVKDAFLIRKLLPYSWLAVSSANPEHNRAVSSQHEECDHLAELVSSLELEEEIATFIEHCNHQRYHEALSKVTPADVYYGRAKEILIGRGKVKQRRLTKRRKYNLKSTQKKGVGKVIDSFTNRILD